MVVSDWTETKYMIADKGHDDVAVRISIKKAEKIPVIPRKSNAIVPGLEGTYKPYYRTQVCNRVFFWSNKRK